MKWMRIIALAAVVSLAANAGASPEVLKLKKELMTQWQAYSKQAHQAAKGITDKELIKWMDDDKEFILVDVREPNEVAAGQIMALNFKAIPRGMVAPAVGKMAALKPSDTVVFYCKLGFRSAMVAKEIEEVYGYKNLYYLKGGITQWLKNGHEVHGKLGELVMPQ